MTLPWGSYCSGSVVGQGVADGANRCQGRVPTRKTLILTNIEDADWLIATAAGEI
jgi:hypothetical protein